MRRDVINVAKSREDFISKCGFSDLWETGHLPARSFLGTCADDADESRGMNFLLRLQNLGPSNSLARLARTDWGGCPPLEAGNVGNTGLEKSAWYNSA